MRYERTSRSDGVGSLFMMVVMPWRSYQQAARHREADRRIGNHGPNRGAPVSTNTTVVSCRLSPFY
jgi:hypothetical protein